MSETSFELPGRCLRDAWDLAADVVYLNHGSFGPSPRVVLEQREQWTRRLERQPMRFFLDEYDEALEHATRVLAEFVHADPDGLLLVDNATVAMNIVAASVDFQPGDEVVVTDHEYGAVLRLWRQVCRRVDARLVVAELPWPMRSAEGVVEAVIGRITPATRLIVASHVTSPTAAVLPIELICQEAERRGVPVCVDGPHAVAMQRLDLKRMGCRFYTASCHKWLSAPFGSGFLYVAPNERGRMRSPITSWGRSPRGRRASWRDEFRWWGTRDPSAVLSIPSAVEFLREYGLETFRTRTHALARYARRRISERTGIEPPLPDDDQWYGSMVAVPLPGTPSRAESYQVDPLQEWLRHEEGIEVPVVTFRDRRYLRVSCHLYNDIADIDRLLSALDRRLESNSAL